MMERERGGGGGEIGPELGRGIRRVSWGDGVFVGIGANVDVNFDVRLLGWTRVGRRE